MPPSQRFIKKIPPSATAPAFKLSLPHQIVHTHLSHLVGVNFELATSTTSGEVWPASITPRRNKNRSEYTLKGWKLFAEAHMVQNGDQYSFELVGENRLVIEPLTGSFPAPTSLPSPEPSPLRTVTPQILMLNSTVLSSVRPGLLGIPEHAHAEPSVEDAMAVDSGPEALPAQIDQLYTAVQDWAGIPSADNELNVRHSENSSLLTVDSPTDHSGVPAYMDMLQDAADAAAFSADELKHAMLEEVWHLDALTSQAALLNADRDTGASPGLDWLPDSKAHSSQLLLSPSPSSPGGSSSTRSCLAIASPSTSQALRPLLSDGLVQLGRPPGSTITTPLIEAVPGGTVEAIPPAEAQVATLTARVKSLQSDIDHFQHRVHRSKEEESNLRAFVNEARGDLQGGLQAVAALERLTTRLSAAAQGPQGHADLLQRTQGEMVGCMDTIRTCIWKFLSTDV